LGRQLLFVIIVAAALVVVSGSIYVYAIYSGPQTVMQTNPDTVNCRQGNVLDSVDRQARFTVLSTCKMAVGIVHDMSGNKQDDGDYQFNLDVEPQYKKLLNDQNNAQVKGMLVVEIIPKDQSSATVQIPKNGDKIEVHGAWVTDNPHGWNEIHPAWMVKEQTS
jgi:cell division protein YceG involved in septum cleavage